VLETVCDGSYYTHMMESVNKKRIVYLTALWLKKKKKKKNLTNQMDQPLQLLSEPNICGVNAT